MDNITSVVGLLELSFQFILLVFLVSPVLFVLVENRKSFIKCISFGSNTQGDSGEKYDVEDPRISLSERMAALNHVDLDYFNVVDRTLDSTICSLNSSCLSRPPINISGNNNIMDEKEIIGEEINDGEVSSRFDAFETPPSAFRHNIRKTRRLGQPLFRNS
ncbi:Hypothetical protein SRAE_2000202100 [Strongyloides ratti]|uniref:Uncharacterized protein n=1 Tax=Strongyloides ratti TaxID=34506 RepID=A0A090LC60_STRRB|nr:Hypothetical protein SRAE_2000202100 [Strongyloides ratti]CEF67357.1 Hypothetical protein SRAE_2000202100 [Strongyloides ratti]